MPTLTITKNYHDNSTLDASELDNAFDAISTFLNVTKIDSSNIQVGGVAATNLAVGSVDSTKIASASVTAPKLGSDVTAQLVPTGMWAPYSGDAAPTGWLLCDGTAVSRTLYSALYGVLGTKHGAGDGTTTFNLPDMRGMFVRGHDAGAGHDPEASSRTAAAAGGNTGDAIGSLQGDEVGTHGHGVTDPTHEHALGANPRLPGSSGTAMAGLWNNGGSLISGQMMTPDMMAWVQSNSGYGNTGSTPLSSVAAATGVSVNNSTGAETRPKNISANWIIKT